MKFANRRTFLAKTSFTLAGTLTAGDALLAELACAAKPSLPEAARPTPSVKALVELIKTTPRQQCVAAVVRELQAGLSYHDFLSALFQATLDHGDPHQVAQVYAAHRVASEAPAAERLLPLFWVLDRIALGFEQQAPRKMVELGGKLPAVDRAGSALTAAMARQDPVQAERAIVAVARAHGPRRAMDRLWRYSLRRAAGTLGHHPIMAANAHRTLDALNWERAEPVLRYLAGAFCLFESDKEYEPNLRRAQQTVAQLPADWTGGAADRAATLELYGLMRRGDAAQACDLVCSMLATGRAQAASIWDAIHLTASDLVYRYRTGGGPIGSVLIHAVTMTNATRFAFECAADDDVRLLAMLASTSALGELFVTPGIRENQLREMNLVDLAELAKPSGAGGGRLEDIFAKLPAKAYLYTQKSDDERRASDEACRATIAFVAQPGNAAEFTRMARGLLCRKASADPHDMKYPTAIFEDVRSASAAWRPYLLASSVHALHGPASADSPALVAARAALATAEIGS